jgi:hypothetical protein
MLKIQLSGPLAALFLTPLLPSVVYGVAALFSSDVYGEYVTAFAVWSCIGYFYSLMLLAVFGVPIFFLARKVHLDRWWLALVAGTTLGVVASTIMRLGPRSIFAPLGAATGALFWFIATRNTAPHSQVLCAEDDTRSSK